VQEVNREDPGGLGLQELPPRRTRPARHRTDARSMQEPRTVDGATVLPSFMSSPWILRGPHSGFSLARRTTRRAMPRAAGDVYADYSSVSVRAADQIFGTGSADLQGRPSVRRPSRIPNGVQHGPAVPGHRQRVPDGGHGSGRLTVADLDRGRILWNPSWAA
jgi:hypothetical protein